MTSPLSGMTLDQMEFYRRQNYTYLDPCVFCRRALYDGKIESGFSGEGEDPVTSDGDFGCNSNPINDDEGTGPHLTTSQLKKIYVAWERLHEKTKGL